MNRLPADLDRALDRHRGEFRRDDVKEDVGAGRLEFCDLRIDRRVGDLVGHLGHDRDLAAKPVLQSLDVILPERVVLIKDRDLSARVIFQKVFRIDVTFGLVARLKTRGPRKLARLVPHRRAGRDEQLRHLVGVQIGLHGRHRIGAEARECQENLVLLDELAGHIQRLRRIIGVVIRDEPDPAAVDAAFGVDLVEIRRDHLADDAIGRGRAAVGHRVADPDLAVARPCRQRLFREQRAGHGGKRQQRRNAALRRGAKPMQDLRDSGLKDSGLEDLGVNSLRPKQMLRAPINIGDDPHRAPPEHV